MFVLVATTRPAYYPVTRSTGIAAPAEVVLAQVKDSHKWDAWSPLAKLDAARKQMLEGAEAGGGAVCSWASYNEVGEGHTKIIESGKNELLGFKLEFLKPMASTCSTFFTIKGEGGQTGITWMMSGMHNFVGKEVCMVKNMNGMVGGDFEKGLPQMKSAAEEVAKQ